uniref:FG-GAP repeat protein n=1 Tax=Salinispora arenicola (strain CNS-205) TaxID=391037 RepID=A8M7U6_SALAI
MSRIRAGALLVATSVAISGLTAAGPAYATDSISLEDALTGPPIPAELTAAIEYTDCVVGGPTATDQAIANQVRPKLNGPRLGGTATAYNISCARIITETIRNRGLAKRAAVIAVTVAITESTLHNYTEAVDHDSLGLFQQRPSQGWGTPAQIIDPVYSTNAFLNAMLRKFPNNSWMTGDIGDICQTVQVSAFPDAYDREVHDAGVIVDALWSPFSHNLLGDYDGDGKSDLAFYRPTTGTWWLHDTNDDPIHGSGTQYGGQTGDTPAPGDYDGDGKSDLAFYRPTTGTWWLHDTNDNPIHGSGTQYGGQTGDIPVPGDYDGDGKSDFAFFRPTTGTWWIHDTNDDPVQGTGTQYGQAGDIPVPGDYDGDGKSDFALYRPSTGTWWIHDTNDNPVHGTGTQYGGQTGDTPAPGDYDGDGKSDLAFYRPTNGTWWIHDTNDDPIHGSGTQYGGQTGDTPAPGDYDGDGKSDFAFYRPTNGTWWIHDTNDNPVQGTGTQYGGQTGDTPTTQLTFTLIN